MILQYLAVIASVLTLPFVLIVNAILTVIPTVPAAPTGSIDAIFGTMGVFNSVLPVTEMLVFAGIAISLKLALFIYKMTIVVYELFNSVIKTFLNIRS